MNTGKIIPIAYPDTFVRYASEFVQHKIFPYLGLGKNGYIKGGHALLLLIENATGYIHYFDFGRYVTPNKTGRVRSEKTDVELHIPIKAELSPSGKLINIEEILIWLEGHPEKTHGDGRMIASVCDEVNYYKALNYINNIQSQGSIPYLTFSSTVGSNCSRLVTDTLINSVNNTKIVKKMKRNNHFTPSPLGNVKYGANGGDMYKVYKGEITTYTNSVLKENLINFFDSNIPKDSLKKLPKQINNAQLLEAIGASAYFEIIATQSEEKYIIKRYTADFVEDFEGIFLIDKIGFNIDKEYEFVFDCNCSYCHVKQEDTVYRLDFWGQQNLLIG